VDSDRCPDCAAVLAMGARWCPLCFRPLAAPDASVQAPATDTPAVRREAGDGRASEAPDAPLDLRDDLAALLGAPAGAVLSAPRAFSTPGGRVGIMVAGTVTLMAVLLIAMWLLGSVVPTR
jgi:hypothetical protein